MIEKKDLEVFMKKNGEIERQKMHGEISKSIMGRQKW